MDLDKWFQSLTFALTKGTSKRHLIDKVTNRLIDETLNDNKPPR